MHKKSLKTLERDIRLEEAISLVKKGEYKSSYKAAKDLGLRPKTLRQRVLGNSQQRRIAQITSQHLSITQEEVLVKWIKDLLIGRYALDYRLLQEIAEEIYKTPIFSNFENSTTISLL